MFLTSITAVCHNWHLKKNSKVGNICHGYFYFSKGSFLPPDATIFYPVLFLYQPFANRNIINTNTTHTHTIVVFEFLEGNLWRLGGSLQGLCRKMNEVILTDGWVGCVALVMGSGCPPFPSPPAHTVPAPPPRSVPISDNQY